MKKQRSKALPDEVRIGFSCRALELIEEECGATAHETGGMLLGQLRWTEYGLEYEVTHATPPGQGSVSGPTTFVRGADFAKRRLDYLANKFGVRYLGEWHKHAVSRAPQASPKDCSTIRAIACKPAYDIEFPVLVIANKDGKSLTIYASDCRKVAFIRVQHTTNDAE